MDVERPGCPVNDEPGGRFFFRGLSLSSLEPQEPRARQARRDLPSRQQEALATQQDRARITDRGSGRSSNQGAGWAFAHVRGKASATGGSSPVAVRDTGAAAHGSRSGKSTPRIRPVDAASLCFGEAPPAKTTVLGQPKNDICEREAKAKCSARHLPRQAHRQCAQAASISAGA
jgi:hypothetical protein